MSGTQRCRSVVASYRRGGLVLLLVSCFAVLVGAQRPPSGFRLLPTRPTAPTDSEFGFVGRTTPLRSVAGTVVARTSAPTGPHGERGIHTRVVVSGPKGDEAFWVPGGEWNGHLRVLSEQPAFGLGSEVKVMVRAGQLDGDSVYHHVVQEPAKGASSKANESAIDARSGGEQ